MRRARGALAARYIKCARPTGVVMFAPQTLLRKAEGLQSEGRARGGIRKARPLPNLTPSPLNVVNVPSRVFKAYPLVQAAMCLDKTLEGHGGLSGGVPHSLRRSAQAGLATQEGAINYPRSGGTAQLPDARLPRPRPRQIRCRSGRPDRPCSRGGGGPY